MELKYANPSHAGAQYNGNIAEMLWRRGAVGQWAGYKFNYYGVNRLTNGEGIDGNSNREEITGYDKNGNITSLNRWFDGNHRDALSYSYDGNRLAIVTDGTQNGEGF